MKILILVALITLPVVILTQVNQYKFGDIISVRRSYCGFSYKHFAIYVDNVDLPNKKPGQDIFQRIGKKKSPDDCGFGELKDLPNHTLDNYLDSMLQDDVRAALNDRKLITDRIKQWAEHCGNYNVFTNNCEHLATHVRYGYNVSKQKNTTAAWVCNMKIVKSCSDFMRKKKEMEENEKQRKKALSCEGN